jgi:hypothetical protein
LTDKQKKERAQAEIQRKALLASGVRIEGLEQSTSSMPPGPPKKVVYGSKKKKPLKHDTSTPSPGLTPQLRNLQLSEEVDESTEQPAESSIQKTADDPPLDDVGSDVKDDWDASSDEDSTSPLAVPTLVNNHSTCNQRARTEFIERPIPSRRRTITRLSSIRFSSSNAAKTQGISLSTSHQNSRTNEARGRTPEGRI